MAPLLLTLRFVHLLSMALWFAHALQVTSRLRALSSDPSRDNATRQRSAGPLNHVAFVGLLASGLGLIFQDGGMGAVPWPIHAALLIAPALWALLFYAERGLASVADAIAKGSGDTEGLTARLRSLRLTTVVFHVGWTLMLALMVFRYRIAG